MPYPEYNDDMRVFEALDQLDRSTGTVGQLRRLIRLVRYLLTLTHFKSTP